MGAPMEEIREGFKETELGLLPADWEVVKLEDIGEIITGNTPSKKNAEYWSKGEIDFIKPPDLQNRVISTFSEKISKQALKRARTVKEGSVLVSCIGIIGRVGFAQKLLAFNQQINAIVPNNSICNKFLFYVLQFQQNQIQNLASFTTVPIVTKTKFAKVKIPLPPLSEQKKIAAVLSAAQEAKEKTEVVIGATKALKKSMLKYLFTYGPVPLQDAQDVPLKETEIGPIPADWEVAKLGNDNLLLKTQYGLSLRGQKEGKYPILRMTNLVNGSISTSDLQFVNLDKNEFEKFKLEKGDIIFNRTNSFDLVGKTSIFTGDEDFVFASYLIRIKINDNKIFPLFLNYYFNWGSTQKRLKYLASRGASQANISATKLKTFKIPLPPLSTQQKIASILSAIDQKIEAEKNKKKALDELFKSLLQNLMTAKIRVNQLEVEI